MAPGKERELGTREAAPGYSWSCDFDGQAIRASKITVSKGRRWLSVCETSFTIVQAQELLDDKRKELARATQLVRKHDTQNAIITVAAMHTQVERAASKPRRSYA